MKKIAFVFVIIGSMLISACLKVESRINADGSGTWAFGMFFAEETLRTSNQESPAPDAEKILSLLDGTKIEDTESGIVFSAEERLQNGGFWVYIIAEVPDIDRWSRVPDAFTRNVISPDSDFLPLDGFFLAPEVTLNRSTGVMRVELNAPPPAEIASEELTADNTAALLQFSYEVILPGEITDHNGTIDPLTGNPIWIIDFASTEPIEFFAEASLD